MRTLTNLSRYIAVTAAVTAAILILGGSYFVGYVGEIQRGLSDPASANFKTSAHVAKIEGALGYSGYLKSYRSFRLTGEPSMHRQMIQQAADAGRALDVLRQHYRDVTLAAAPLEDAKSVIDAFAQVANSAPDMGPAVLRGTQAMDALSALPQPPQLEATYLTLRSALDRLKAQTQGHQLGGVSSALTWSQWLIVLTLAALVVGLTAAAGLLQLRIALPIKSLETSLAQLGEGKVNDPVWGTDRRDEFGAIARAGEKLRKTISESETWKDLAKKGEVHITLEGEASLLIQKLSADVTGASQALKIAAEELSGLREKQQTEMTDTVQQFNQTHMRLDGLTDAIRSSNAAMMNDLTDDVRNSMTKLLHGAQERMQRLGEVVTTVEESGRQLAVGVSAIKEKTGHAIDGMTTSITAFRKAADGAEHIQGAFFAACDKISSDASSTAENIRNLAAKLYSVVENVDGRLTDKIGSLDQLEKGIESALNAVRSKTDETTNAIAEAAQKLAARDDDAEERIGKTVTDVEDIVRLFRDAAPLPTPISTDVIATIEKANDGLTRAVEDRIAQGEQVAALIAQLNTLAEKFSASRQITISPPTRNDNTAINQLSAKFDQQIETIRAEIRDLSLRMTEERIMLSADMPAPGKHAHYDLQPQRPRKSLAEVPANEILDRLKNLAEEMQSNADRPAVQPGLISSLASFAAEVKKLANPHSSPDAIHVAAPALEHHANVIESNAHELETSASALRTELSSITQELRKVAAIALVDDEVSATAIRDSISELGARAESLFSYLNQTHGAELEPEENEPSTIAETSEALSMLALLIGKLEARTSHMSDAEVAASLAGIMQSASPSETREHGPRASHPDQAIKTVYESIEKLNSIAAALARANDALHHRRAAH